MCIAGGMDPRLAYAMAVLREELQREIENGKHYSMERLRELVPAKPSSPGGSPAAADTGRGPLCDNCGRPIHDLGTHRTARGTCLHWYPGSYGRVRGDGPDD